MNYRDYIEFVKERTSIKSDDRAKKTIESVIEVLGQRISAGQAEDVAEALPAELKPFLMQTASAEPFNLREFLKRISEREGVDVATAGDHAHAVLSVLAEWIPSADLRHTLEQLPHDMRFLFVWTGKAA